MKFPAPDIFQLRLQLKRAAPANLLLSVDFQTNFQIRKGGMQERRNSGLEGYRKRGIQERRDSGLEGFRTGRIKEKRDKGKMDKGKER